jgi:hypothetical protein
MQCPPQQKSLEREIFMERIVWGGACRDEICFMQFPHSGVGRIRRFLKVGKERWKLLW